MLDELRKRFEAELEWVQGKYPALPLKEQVFWARRRVGDELKKFLVSLADAKVTEAGEAAEKYL